jgi:hypothetical protein
VRVIQGGGRDAELMELHLATWGIHSVRVAPGTWVKSRRGGEVHAVAVMRFTRQLFDETPRDAL